MPSSAILQNASLGVSAWCLSGSISHGSRERRWMNEDIPHAPLLPCPHCSVFPSAPHLGRSHWFSPHGGCCLDDNGNNLHPLLFPQILNLKMKRRIRNPVTGTAYEIRTRSSKAGTKPPPRGLWSQTHPETHDKQNLAKLK